MTTTDEATFNAQQQAKAAAEAPAPKPKIKKAPKKPAPAKPDVTNAALQVGTVLLGLVKQARTTVAGGVGALAKRLADDGRLTHKDLVALRDEVKALAVVLREQKKPALASKFAAANRLVRRLERAARLIYQKGELRITKPKGGKS